MNLSKSFVIFARQNADANEKIISLLDTLSNEDREKDRGSYYGSLSALVRHILDGTRFLTSLLTKALASNGGAEKALSIMHGLPKTPEGALSAEQWKALCGTIKEADAAYTSLTEALAESDLAASAEVPIYGGNPAAVPVAFMLQQLVAHNIHHRGQISQIFDSLKIDHNYSGISPAFL
ncbi:MAG: DUF664 domain-containing protein [Spirochaetaceae bacterium]|jgi:uncharacterized damage-inducible protein DinB|nr:DUF664 domain-containing protein [Spirochaetaceae bacterium]